MKSIFDFSLTELSRYFKDRNKQGFIAKQLFDWIYKKKIVDIGKMSNLSEEIRNFLKKSFSFELLKLVKKETSKDKTEKFLFQLSDGVFIETVLIPSSRRRTICLSTQVGCKYKCSFCASGEKGFKRNLTVSEIINQYLFLADKMSPEKITNIVFMGIGEPLDNFDNLIKSIDIFKDKAGIGLGKRKISLSTCGLAPEIKKLAKLQLGIKLSISLHAGDDFTRSKLVPVNKKFPLRILRQAIDEYLKLEPYPVSFEYILIAGLNSKVSDASKLARYLRGIKAKVNLIPYNPPAGKSRAPEKEDIEAFKDELNKRGVFASIRTSRGEDIKGACGQLRAKFIF